MVDEWSSANQQRRDQCNAAGSDIVPPAAGVLPSGQRSIGAECNSTIVFCGDAQQVSYGFALALNAMESNADVLLMGIEPVPEGIEAYARSAGEIGLGLPNVLRRSAK
jgi:hypothetical protein